MRYNVLIWLAVGQFFWKPCPLCYIRLLTWEAHKKRKSHYIFFFRRNEGKKSSPTSACKVDTRTKHICCGVCPLARREMKTRHFRTNKTKKCIIIWKVIEYQMLSNILTRFFTFLYKIRKNVMYTFLLLLMANIFDGNAIFCMQRQKFYAAKWWQ